MVTFFALPLPPLQKRWYTIRKGARQSLSSQGRAFSCPPFSQISAAFPKTYCPRVSHRFCSNGKRSRFSVLRTGRNPVCYKNDALCRQWTLGKWFSPRFFPIWKQLQRTWNNGGMPAVRASASWQESPSPMDRWLSPTPASSLASWPSWVQWPSSITYSE